MTTVLTRGVIFSDLDGTFLDGAYTPVLAGADAQRIFSRWHVVWVSSRTADELCHFQQSIAHTGDAIGENGGVLLLHDRVIASALGPVEPFHDAWLVRLAKSRAQTLQLVQNVFADVGAALHVIDDASDLASASGYSLPHAERALRRRKSVLLRPSADPRFAAALALLRAAGAFVAHGGRWISIVVGADKGAAARAWLAAQPEPFPIVAGIGNAGNDESLLREVDLPFVVRDAHHGHAPALASIVGVRLLQRQGTQGWLEMLELLDSLAGRDS